MYFADFDESRQLHFVILSARICALTRKGFLTRMRLITVLIWLLAVVIYLPGFLRMNYLSATLRSYRQQEVQLSGQNRRLREEIVALKTNPLLTEKLARRELGLIREGEWIVRRPNR